MAISSLSRRIQATLLIGTALICSACATTSSQETVRATEAVKEDATRTTLAKGIFEAPPEIHPSSMSKMMTAESTPPKAAAEQVTASGATDSRINAKEARVNVRSAPTTKGSILAVLKAGQQVQVLETRGSWMRISWLDGVTPRNGWLKKDFVESN